MVCGGLRWFDHFLTAHGHIDVLSSQIRVVVCGGVWWFAVVCGGLRWIAVVCLLVIPERPAFFPVHVDSYEIPTSKSAIIINIYDVVMQNPGWRLPMYGQSTYVTGLPM